MVKNKNVDSLERLFFKIVHGGYDMQKIFYSELLKLRHLGTTKFLIIIPFLTVLIAFLMGGLQYFLFLSRFIGGKLSFYIL